MKNSSVLVIIITRFPNVKRVVKYLPHLKRTIWSRAEHTLFDSGNDYFIVKVAQ
jgi:hypothetical protein